jgi:hypothetical protein
VNISYDTVFSDFIRSSHACKSRLIAANGPSVASGIGRPTTRRFGLVEVDIDVNLLVINIYSSQMQGVMIYCCLLSYCLIYDCVHSSRSPRTDQICLGKPYSPDLA